MKLIEVRENSYNKFSSVHGYKNLNDINLITIVFNNVKRTIESKFEGSYNGMVKIDRTTGASVVARNSIRDLEGERVAIERVAVGSSSRRGSDTLRFPRWRACMARVHRGTNAKRKPAPCGLDNFGSFCRDSAVGRTCRCNLTCRRRM